MSDPWRIAQLVKLQAGVSLDAVLVLVDAASFTTHLRDRWLADTLERQLARADLIVLTKCDLADPGDARHAVLRLRPDARIVTAAGGAIPNALLGLGDPSPGRRLVADMPEHGFRTWHWAADRHLDPGASAGGARGLASHRAPGERILSPGPGRDPARAATGSGTVGPSSPIRLAIRHWAWC